MTRNLVALLLAVFASACSGANIVAPGEVGKGPPQTVEIGHFPGFQDLGPGRGVGTSFLQLERSGRVEVRVSISDFADAEMRVRMIEASDSASGAVVVYEDLFLVSAGKGSLFFQYNHEKPARRQIYVHNMGAQMISGWGSVYFTPNE
jgi:hypothetical protein